MSPRFEEHTKYICESDDKLIEFLHRQNNYVTKALNVNNSPPKHLSPQIHSSPVRVKNTAAGGNLIIK
jgi:hypothetical protein